MKEQVLMDLGLKDGKAELSLTNKRVILGKEPFVTYGDETKEIPIGDVQSVEVKEMDLSASFVFNWMGIELALILIFFGLTSASVPLYDVYRTMTIASISPKFIEHLGRLILSLIMIWLGIMLIPWFDGIIIRIKSKGGKTIRYVKNIRSRKKLEKFKFLLVKEVQKKMKKK
jgi:hypothetical protein